MNLPAIGLGCMSLSHAYGIPPSDDDGRALLHAALDLGVRFFDTATLYGGGRNERLVGGALRDAGMEVIYTGLRQTPEMVVDAALQEDVDAIGVSILSGAHMTVFPRIINLMKERGMHDVLLTGGGIIPYEDARALNEMGVGTLFPPGTNTGDIARYIDDWVAGHRNF